MDQKFPDSMVLQAISLGREMTASQALDQARKFLLGLETVSPWRRPFDVSGITAKCGYLPIREDFSDFDDVVMKALGSYKNIRYRNANDPDNWRLTMGAMSPQGFTTTFSDYVQKRSHEKSTVVSIKTSGIPPLDYAYLVITVLFFKFGEVNRDWSEAQTVRAVFDYLIDFCDATYCVIYGSYQNLKNREFGDGYNLGWLTYIRNLKLRAALSGDRRTSEYRNGTLLKLGEDVSVLTDPKIDGELLEIRNKLRVTGVTDWTKL